MLQSLIREMGGVILRVLAPQSLRHPLFTHGGMCSSPLGCIPSFLILRHGIFFSPPEGSVGVFSPLVPLSRHALDCAGSFGQ